MLQWLKEFRQECPWYFWVLLVLWGWLSMVGWVRTFPPQATLPVLVAGLYLIRRWKLLPNPAFHVTLFLSGLLAVVIRFWLESVCTDSHRGGGETWPEPPALIGGSLVLATAVALVVPRLPFLRRRLPASAILSPPGRAALCLFLLATACYPVWEETVVYVLLVLYGY